MADREEIIASWRVSPRLGNEREHKPVNDGAINPSEDGPAAPVNADWMMSWFGGSAYDVRGPYTDYPTLPATLERRLRDAGLQDFLQYYSREYRHHSRIRIGEVLPLDESVLTSALGRLERTVVTVKESQRAVRYVLADAEERLDDMTTRAERSELLLTILTDAVARGGNQENTSSKCARIQ
jgi:hypothetical protein